MTADLDALRRKIEVWDPETGDLPDEVALAMDEHPELRAVFDARFASLVLPEEPVPEALFERVVPPDAPVVGWRRGARRASQFALAAVAMVVLGLAASTLLLAPAQVDQAAFVDLDDRAVHLDPGDGIEPDAAFVAPGDGDLLAAAPELGEPLFDPDLPAAPRRLPLKPQRYTQPPPGGPLQYEAVSAARRRDCPTAMAAVQEGMRDVSIDYATLYRGTWLCFNEAHQRKLEQDESPTWGDFVYQLVHFEGAPEAMAAASDRDPTRRRYPRWFRDPVGGIEYRLKQYAEDEQMVDVLDDLIGNASIADHLAKDVHLEALAAVGLSRVPPAERTPAQIDSWARRVYFTAWALRNRPGRLLDAHRKELVLELRELLDDATSSPEGTSWPVPKVVAQARLVGEGHAPAPRLVRHRARSAGSPEELMQLQVENELQERTMGGVHVERLKR